MPWLNSKDICFYTQTIDIEPVFGMYILDNLYQTILFKTVRPEMRAEWVPFWSYREAIRFSGGFAVTNANLLEEIILNVLLYIPMGYLLPFVWEKLRAGGKRFFSWRDVLIGFLCSVVTEVTQLVFRIGLFEFDDMIGNTAGGLIGYVLYEIIRQAAERRNRNRQIRAG